MGEFDFLLKLSFDLGAQDAKIITTDKIVVEDRVLLKCKYGCDEYGTKLVCPPYVPTPDEFRKMLKEYEYALVLKFRSSAKVKDDNVARSLLKNQYSPDTPPELKERTIKFWSDWKKDKMEVLKAILELEKAAFNKGYTLAWGMQAGSCVLCEKCNVKGLCIHPTMARLTPHSMGVNEKETARKVGITLNFPFEKPSPSLFAMMLIK